MSRKSSPARPIGRPDLLVLGLIAVALAVRLWGVADRLPDPTLGIDPIVANTAVDEGDRRAMHYAWEMWRGGTQSLDLNPKTGDWPGLPFYVTLGLQVLHRVCFSITHGDVPAGTFEQHVARDPAAMFLFARFFSVLVGALTVYLVYVLGKKLHARTLGLTAALLLALNPFHILTSQRVSDPNLLALAFVLIATIQLVGEGREGRTYASLVAGAMIGLAAACKYVPFVLIAVLVLANIEIPEPPAPRTLRIRWRAVTVGVLAALAAFVIASPYTLLDWGNKAHSLSLQRGRLLSEWVGLSASPVSLPTYLFHTLPDMLGWPAYLFSIAGCVLLFALRPRGWVVALIPWVLLVPTGSLALAQERFMMPAIGSLVIASAYAILRLASSWRERMRGRAPVAASLALWLPLALSIAWPVPGYVHTRDVLRRADTRVVAHRWIESSIQRTEPLALEVYGPEFDTNVDGRRSLVWPFLATQTALVRAAYHHQWLDGIRYCVTASEVEGRFEAAAGRYPDEAAFHRWIRSHGAVVWTSDSTVAAGPRIEIWALPDGISRREERDSLWAVVRQRPMYGPRLARWSSEMAAIFLKRDQYARAEEWAARGLMIKDAGSRKELLETLSLSQVRLNQPLAAEETARMGLLEFPESSLLHVSRAMALEGLSRRDEAIAEYGAALLPGSSERAAEVIRAQIARLKGGRR